MTSHHAFQPHSNDDVKESRKKKTKKLICAHRKNVMGCHRMAIQPHSNGDKKERRRKKKETYL
jgi:hypothetical protein